MLTGRSSREFLAVLAFGVGVERVSVEVESCESNVGRARRFVHEQLQSWGLAEDYDFVDRVLLVVSELATNAVLHGRTLPQDAAETLGLTLAWKRGCVFGVMVTDNSCKVPLVRMRVSPSARGGRGLVLVNAQSDGWTADPRRSGKAVWAFFECARSAVLPELMPQPA